MNKLLCFLLSIFFNYAIGFGQKTETVYLNAKDSTSNLYVIIYPQLPLKGYLFLIPGMFQKPADVLIQTDLPIVAAQQGLLTIIPTFKTGISSFGIDTATQTSFVHILNYVRSTYNLRDKPLYVGGFSIGGTNAIKYAEAAISSNYAVKPSAIFAIDAPLDFERMYNTSLRAISNEGTDKNLLAEKKYMVKRYDQEFGGAPKTFRNNYHKRSPYSFSDSTKQAIQPLVNLPIRLYTEPDVEWWLDKGSDYSGMNAFDFAAMTNDLKRMGNKKITLITTTNKGYRKPDNIRHPHSWSIADPNDLVRWLLEQK